LAKTGVVVVVLDEELEVGGGAVDGDTARTIKNVDPMNNTTMINTTLSEGWKCDPETWALRGVEDESLISPTLGRLDAIH
jgi:hypothetical protein